MSLDDWAEQGETVSTEELRLAVERMLFCRNQEDDAKKILKGLAQATEEAENSVLALLEKAKTTKFFVDGIGTAYTINKYSVTTPKDNDSKRLLWEYIRTKYGPEVLDDYLSIHSGRLNSFYNEEFEIAKKEGASDFNIPGLQPPTLSKSLGFRKA